MSRSDTTQGSRARALRSDLERVACEGSRATRHRGDPSGAPPTQVCIVDAAGTVVREQRIHTTRERFAALLDGRPRARILLEAATE